MKLKKENSHILKNQIINTVMKSGKKRTSEKVLLTFSKSIQKSTKKNIKSLVQLAVVNSSSAFKLNEQIMKKGKRKSKTIIPSFVIKDSRRIMMSIKVIKEVALKDRSSSYFYKNFAKEVRDASFGNGRSVEERTKLQNNVLLNKRYLAKFRW